MRRRVMDNSVVDGHTLLLLRFDGNLVDSSRNKIIVQAVGMPSYVKGKFGECFIGDTSADHKFDAIIPQIGLNNFTIDLWFKITSYIEWYKLLETGADDTAGMFNIDLNAQGKYLRFYTANCGQNIFLTSSTLIPLNTWNHVAIIRNSNVFSLYLNGVLLSSGVQNNVNLISTKLYTRGKYCFDELRISDIARWTSDFNPSSKPY